MKVFGYILGAIAAIVSVILFVDWLNKHIDDRVKEITSSDQFLTQLSESTRPFVIFNDKNTILYDGGGLKYVDSVIAYKGIIDGWEYVTKIVLKPKHFMKIIPWLECIDIEHRYQASRGEGTTIIYEIRQPSASGYEEIRFRLEIFK